MAQVDDKEFRRILTTLGDLGWRIECKEGKSAALVYPLDKDKPPVHVFKCRGIAAKGIYQALRRHGIELELSRGRGKVKVTKAHLAPPTPRAEPVEPASTVDPQAAPAPVPEDLDEIAAREWRIGAHALERTGKRLFTVKEVMATVLHPESTWESDQEAGVEMRKRGDCLLAVNPRTKFVMTVLDVNSSRNGTVPRNMAAANGVKPKPVPEPETELVTERLFTDSSLQKLIARTKVSKVPAGETNWGSRPPKVPAPRRAPELNWVFDVALPKLRGRPGEWARLTTPMDSSRAFAVLTRLTEYHPEMELAMRDGQIWLRWRAPVRTR